MAFPDVTLGPGEFLIVYASGLDVQEGSELHANFKLSAEGEQVVLADSAGRLIEIVSFDNLKADQAYSKQPETGVWTTGLSPTPGSRQHRRQRRADRRSVRGAKCDGGLHQRIRCDDHRIAL